MSTSGRARSRPRASHTCRECRRRKLRCDQARPCGRCVVNSITCTYDVVQEVRFLTPDVLAPRPSTPQSIPSGRLQELEERLESLNDMVRSLRDKGASETMLQQSGDGGSPRRSPKAASDAGSVDDDDGIFAVQGDGRTLYASKSHWANIGQEATEVESLMRSLNSQMSLTEMEDQPWRRGMLTGVLLTTPPVTISSMRASIQRQSSLDAHQLPNKACCDFLLEAYLANHHPIAPLLHEPSFRNDYERYWEIRTDPQTNPTSATPLILAVLWAGTVVCTQSEWDFNCPLYFREEVMLQLYWVASRALHISNFPQRPTVEAIAAYALLQCTSMREEEVLGTAAFVGVIVRAAQMIGLNREPSASQTSVSPIVAEVRRRVWWHVFRIDMLIALSSGLPPLIDRDSWDVRMVSDVCDNMMGTEAAKKYEEELRNGNCMPHNVFDEDSLVSTGSVFARGKLEETLFARELLNKMFHQQSLTLNDLKSTQEELINHQKRMLATALRIPRPTGGEKDQNTDFELNAWTKLALWATGDRYWWYIYSPLLKQQSSTESLDLLPRIVLNSRSFLLKYMCLVACPEFQRFYWTWPGQHQPLHAITLLLRALERDPDAADAQDSRAVVDHIISLCGPHGGITASHGDQIVPRPLVSGGQEAWNVIRRLRTRIWIKAGLNPDTLPTRAQVVQLARDQLALLISELINGRTPEISVSSFGNPYDAWPELVDPSAVPDIYIPMPMSNPGWQGWDTIFHENS